MTDDGSVSDTRDEQDDIIVCQRSDGNYHYFRYKEFKQMIDRGICHLSLQETVLQMIFWMS